MTNNESKTYYDLQVYDHFHEYPLIISNIENFSFDNYLVMSIKDFSFIVIIRYTVVENSTYVVPLVVIYNHNLWNVTYEEIENICGESRTMTYCSNGKETLSYGGKLKLFSCNTQEQMVDMFAKMSKKLNKSKTLKNVLTRKKSRLS